MADDERPDAPGEDTPDLAADDVAEPMPAADPSEAPIAGDEPTAEDPAGGAPPEADTAAAAEEAPAAEEPPADAPEVAEEPGEAPAPAAEAATPEDAPPVEEAPVAEDTPSEDAPAADAAPASDATPAPPAPAGDDAVPGAHLEPDLVLESPQASEGEFGVYGDDDASTEPATAVDGEAQEQPAPRKVVDLAADARYLATGKRKTAVARVILRPGTGAYTINGRTLDEFFPRPTLQRTARGPLETAGYETRMDVVARLHGGGVSAQAGALRHGIARALVEADPALRGELKKQGFLTRDARAKERKKAGLKKARKRPQFSKR